MKKKMKLMLLCGDGGGDAIAIIKAMNANVLKNSEITCLLAESENKLLSFFKASNTPKSIKTYKSESKFSALDALQKQIDFDKPDYVFLAGFKFILPESFLTQSVRFINTHHSLLPAYKGLFNKEFLVSQNISLLGHTIHYVNKEVDEGKQIAQFAFPNFGMRNFEKILKTYRLGADVLNLTVLQLLESKDSNNRPMKFSYEHLVFSLPIEEEVLNFAISIQD